MDENTIQELEDVVVEDEEGSSSSDTSSSIDNSSSEDTSSTVDNVSTETDLVATVGVYEHPFLTTNFEEYTVTEGLLVLFLVLFVCCIVWKILKRGFEKWL